MMIKEAMSVFWQTLKDTWEELYSIAIVNLVWVFSWALPAGLAVGTGIPALIVAGVIVSLCTFAVGTGGVYYVTNRVAHGKTFHFADFVDGMKKLWWRGLLWVLANIAVIIMLWINFNFYPQIISGTWVIIVGGFWLSVFVFWMGMQMYFWPLLVEQETPRMLLAYRNSAYLILANPFYAFFVASFTIVLLAVSIAVTLPFVFLGMGLVGILGNNAALTLLFKFGAIEDPRPRPEL